MTSREYITGTANANKGTVIQVKGYYPPNQNVLDKLNYDKLQLLPAFNNKSKDEIYNELYNNSTLNSDLYLNEVDLKMKFIKIGGQGFKSKLTQEQIDFLLNSEFRSIKDNEKELG